MTAASNVPRPSRSPPARVRPDIVEAATRVFSERGYHAASMTEIAERVGMRKPSLYHHIRQKEDLLFAIHEQLIDELIERTTVALEPTMTPPEQMAAILRVGFRLVARHRDAVTVFLQERRAVSGARWNELVVKRDRYEQMVSGIIAEGTATKAFADLPAAIAARGVLGMVNWGYTWFDPKGEMTAEEIADVFVAIALRGLERR
ncbi:MAG: TetR/AcrR family transcriptional regulator, cholesterol catabolism regulator [Solirubrobacteraceae bacterium]